MNLLILSLSKFITLYAYLLIVRIFLSWFQTEGWANQAMAFLSPVTDPYLNIFRSFIPPLGMIDISPMLAIFLLFIASDSLTRLLIAPGFGY